MSKKLCPDKYVLKEVMSYLYSMGYIDCLPPATAIEHMFAAVRLTDEAYEMIFGKCQITKLSLPINISINFNALSVSAVG